MADEYRPYPTPRAKQACDNCRRKKAKCPGEKPRCSLCVRLRQRCTYATNIDQKRTLRGRRAGAADVSEDVHDATRLAETQPSKLSQRFTSSIEKLNAIRGEPSQKQATINPSYKSNKTNDGSSSQRASPPSSKLILADLQLRHEAGVPAHVMLEAIGKYFEHINNQPYPVLCHLQDVNSLTPQDIPPFVLYPLLALSLQTFSHALTEDTDTLASTLQRLAELTWQLLTAAIGKFEFDIYFFQGLCLLAQVDFASGNTSRAQAQVTLGLNLAQSHGMLSSEDHNQLKDISSIVRRGVVWTLFMMDRIFNSSNYMSPSVKLSFYRLCLDQGGPQNPIHPIREYEGLTLKELVDHSVHPESVTIGALNIELLSIWEAVMADIFDSSATTVPFWQDGSLRSKTLSKLLEAELNCGKHTYLSVGPPILNLRQPQSREYYRTWFFMQLLHSTILCCLNHPFIIYIKTKGLRGRVPLTFLQKSYEYSMIYSNWVVRLISDMRESSLWLYDPFVGYMATIAATIQLEQTLNKNESLGNVAKLKFSKLREFLKDMSRESPIVLVMLGILDELAGNLRQRRTMNRVDREYDGAVPTEPIDNVTISAEDVAVMWKLFDYPEISREYGRMKASTLSSPSVLPTQNLSEADAGNRVEPTTEREPIGSALDSASVASFVDQFDADVANAAVTFDLADFNPREHHEFGEDWMLMGRPWSEYFPGGL